jgi:hypothetical protein
MVMESLVLFFVGAAIGHVGPRLPTLFMTRARGFNLRLEPHPQPVRLSPHLTQRVLHLRTFYWLSFVLAGVVLAFGAASLRWGSAPFGFGLWVASSWLVLSRLQGVLAGRSAPWSIGMAMELQTVADRARSGEACCGQPMPVWDAQCVQCSSCQAVLSRMARPDLGRPRVDGKIRGTLRMLITDGYPLADPLPEAQLEQE